MPYGLIAFLVVALFATGCESVYRGYKRAVPPPALIKVESGDTLYAISRRLKVPIRALININNLRPPYILQTAQELKIPNRHRHRVKRGETLSAIARAYDVSLKELVEFNELKDPSFIKVGDLLFLPDEIVFEKAETVIEQKPPPVQKEVKSIESEVKKPKPQVKRYEKPRSDKKAKPVLKKPKKKQKTVKKRADPIAPGKLPPFGWPIRGKVVSGYGKKPNGLFNDGINIKAPRGTPVKAAAPGQVVYAGNELSGYGNLLLIKHSKGWISAYAHNQEIKVAKGDRVNGGQVVAFVGSSGNVASPQLHFELRRAAKSVNPRPYLPKL